MGARQAEVNDIMAAFDAPPALKQERSAFGQDDDDDGDLGSDIDADGP